MPIAPAIPPQLRDAVGQPSAPGQPPGGPQSISVPAPSQGMKAIGLSQVRWAIRFLEKALPALGAASDEGNTVLGCLQKLGKLAPPGSGSPAVDQSGLQQMLLSQRQQNPVLQRLGGAPQTPQAPPPQAA